MAAKKKEAYDITKSGPLNWRELQDQNNANMEGEDNNFATSMRISSVLAPRTSIYDIDESTPQDVQSSLMNGKGDYWGNSMFDNNFATEDEFQRLGDIRANNQPWWTKALAGIGKGAVLAGTTFVDGTIGLLAGIGQGIANVRDDDPNSGFWQGIWDNPVTQCMNEINKASEELMPNYYTDNQINGPWYSADNLLSANFVFDKVVKNLGFMIGAAYSGGIFAKAVTGATKGIGFVRGAYAARKAGMTAEAMQKAGQLGMQAMEASRATRATKATVGAFFNAQAEATVEAVSNSDDFAEAKTAELNALIMEEYNAATAEYEKNKGTLTPVKGLDGQVTLVDLAEQKYRATLDNLNKKKVDGLQQIELARRGMGNADFAFNIPLLWMGDLLTLGKFYAGGWKAARTEAKTATRATKEALAEAEAAAKAGDKEALKKLQAVVAKAEKTGYQGLSDSEKALVEEVQQEYLLPKWAGYTKAAMKNPVKEGNEEMSQSAASKTAWMYYGDRLDAFYEAYNDPDAKKEVMDWTTAITKGFSEQYGNIENYEEAAIGAITGILGAPTIGKSQNSTDQTWLGRGKTVGLSGGVVTDIRDYRNGRESADRTAENITRIMKNPDLENRLKHLVAQTKLENDKKRAIIHDDKRAFKDAETASIFEDIMYLKKGQRLDLLTSAIESMNMDFTDEEINELVEQTKKAESAYNDRVNDDRKSLDTESKKLDRINQQIENLTAQYEQLMQIYNTLDPNSSDAKLKQSQIDSIQKKLEKLTQEQSEVKDRCVSLETSLNKAQVNELSPYIKPDGTFMNTDEIRQDLKDRAKRVQDIIDDIAQTQDEIDAATGDSYTDEQLTTLTWYNVMMRDWARRSNGIMEIVKDAVQRVLDDPTVNAQLELLDAMEAIPNADKNPMYGGAISDLRKVKKWNKWQKSVYKLLEDIRTDKENAGIYLAYLLNEVTEQKLEDGGTKSYGEYLMDHLKTSIESNTALNGTQKEYLKAQLDDLKELGSAHKKYSELLDEYRKNPEKIDKVHREIEAKADKTVADRKAKSIVDRFNWDGTIGEILKTLEDEKNKADIKNLGGIDKFIKMLNPEQQKKIRQALLLQRGINGFTNYIEDAQLDDITASIANKLIDDNIEAVNTIEELAKKIQDSLNEGYVERVANGLKESMDDRELTSRIPKMEEELQTLFQESLVKVAAQLARIEKEENDRIEAEARKAEEIEKKAAEKTAGKVPVEKEEEPNAPTEGDFVIPREERNTVSLASVLTGEKKEETPEKKDPVGTPRKGTPGYERRPQLSQVAFNLFNGVKYSEGLRSGKIAYPKFPKESGITNEMYLRYIEAMETYFEEKKTYEFVHNGLKAGDTIEFFCDSELDKKVFGEDSLGTKHIVLMKVGDQVVGSIRSPFDFAIDEVSNPKNEDIKAQEALYNAVVNQQYGDGGATITTTVESLLGGNLPLASKDNALTDIFGTETPIIAVVDGEGHFRASNPKVKHENIVHSNQAPGEVYILIPTNNGRYLPALAVSKELSTLKADDPYIKACEEAFLKIGSSATQIGANMLSFWKLMGIDMDTFHVNLYNRQGKNWTPVASLTDANCLAIRFTDGKGNKINRNVTVTDGKADLEQMKSVFATIVKDNLEGLRTRVDMKRLNDEEYVRTLVMPYQTTNLYQTEAVNDWFTYKPTDVELKSKAGTPKSAEIPKGTPGSEHHKREIVVDGKKVEVVLGETIDGAEPPTPGAEVHTGKKGKFNSAFGSIARPGSKGFRAPLGRKKHMQVTESTQQEPMATKQRDALDIEEVKRMFPTLGEAAIKIVHSALLRSTDGNGNPIKAFAMFKDGIVVLAKKHPVGTVYHEAFHYVVDFLLSEEQKARMNEAAVEQYGNLEELELEDKVAEDFRAFMNRRLDKSLTGRIQSFFESLAHIIRGLVGKENYLTSMFYDMYRGHYANIDTTENYARKLQEYKVKKFAYDNLSTEEKNYLELRGVSKDSYESMTSDEKEIFLHCM